MINRVTLEPAYVLHRRAYRNTSYLVDFFTRTHGRISVVAKSARGPASRYRGTLELFVPMLISWTGKHELKNLGHIELYRPPINLQGESLLCAFYLNELLEKVLHREDAHANLFDAYEKALQTILQKEQRESALRCFEKTLLHELGYGLDWQRDVKSGELIDAALYYAYHPERGFSSEETSAEKMPLFKGDTLLAFAKERFTEATQLKEAKRLMRLLLRVLLEGKTLCSRGLF